MPYCRFCGSELNPEAKFCTKCGGAVSESPTTSLQEAAPNTFDRQFPIVTTPNVPGSKIIKVVGIVTGLTPRTRGIFGKFIGGLQSLVGGEVTAFTSEIEKARIEAIERMKAQAKALGANAIVGVDIETSDLLQTLIVISATGTAVVIEPEG